MEEDIRFEQTITHKCDLVLHANVNPSFCPETIITMDIQKPTQTGVQIITKLYKAINLHVKQDSTDSPLHNTGFQ